MTPKFVLFALALALVPGVSAVHANDFSTLEERMTGREFRDTGLHKLTEEELVNLNRWIQLRSLAEGEVPDWTADKAASPAAASATQAGPAAAGDKRGFPGGERSEISSRLVGSFSGWRGDDVFELENGMIWQQAEADSFPIPAVENPAILIRPGMFGSWQLQLEGYNRRVRVQRVQ